MVEVAEVEDAHLVNKVVDGMDKKLGVHLDKVVVAEEVESDERDSVLVNFIIAPEIRGMRRQVAGGAPLDWKWAVINDAQQQLSQRHAEARTSLCAYTSAYVSIRQHTYSIRQQEQACVRLVCLLCWDKSTNTDAVTSTKVQILTLRRRADRAALRGRRRMLTYPDVS